MFPNPAAVSEFGLGIFLGSSVGLRENLLNYIDYGGIDLLYINDLPGALLVLGACTYFFGEIVWIMSITRLYIRRYVRRFGVRIWPKHPDRCGGVRFIGGFCIQMALPLLACVSVLTVAYFAKALLIVLIYLALYHGVPVGNLPTSAVVSLYVQHMTVGLAVVVVPFSVFILLAVTIAVLWPIWSVHRAMYAHQQLDEAAYVRSATRLTDEITAGLAANNLAQARAAKDELELIDAVHVPAEDYPTWPFERRLFVRFVAPQAISVLGAVGTAVLQAHLPH
jgi:hypothetical protein